MRLSLSMLLITDLVISRQFRAILPSSMTIRNTTSQIVMDLAATWKIIPRAGLVTE